MRRGSVPLANLIAAIVLALLVGSVFGMLQDYGPESALRKFHRAVVARNLAGIRRAVREGSRDENINALAAMVERYSSAGAHYRVLKTQRQDRRILALAEYFFADRPIRSTFVWVVAKSGGRWRVDADATVDLRRQMLEQQIFGRPAP